MANCAARLIAGAAFSNPGTALLATTPNAPSVIASPSVTDAPGAGDDDDAAFVGFLTTVVIESSSLGFVVSLVPGFDLAFGDGVFDDRDLPSFLEKTLMSDVRRPVGVGVCREEIETEDEAKRSRED